MARARTSAAFLVFGATLWADFEGRNPDAMKRAGKGCGEFFFVKRRAVDEMGASILTRFRPPDALAAFDRETAALRAFCETRQDSGRSL